jgi:hypothetical protein
MTVVAIILAVVAGVFWAALGEYVTGRIILPPMGLTPPEYWTWFWFTVVMGCFSGPFYFIKGALS